MVHEMMADTGQLDFALRYQLQPFSVRVLSRHRTICEKIMSLVRFSYSNNPVEDLKLKVRHLYDLHMLLQDPECSSFVSSNDFERLLLRVAQEDKKSFRANNAWLNNHPTQSIVFRELENGLGEELLKVYHGSFADLVYGVLPDGHQVLNSVLRIKSRLEAMHWSLTMSESKDDRE